MSGPARGKAAPRALSSRSSARALAAAALGRVLDDGALSQSTLSSVLAGSTLDARDRALCTELFYGALRWAGPLEASLLRSAERPQRGLDKRMRPHLLVAAYQLQFLSERIPARAAVSEAVDGIRAVRPGLEGFANALLRHLGSPLPAMLKDDASLAQIAEAHGVPLALAEALVDGLPRTEWLAAVAGANARPKLYAIALGDAPAASEHHAFVPGAFVVEGAVREQPGFAAGAHLIMDPGSVVVAMLARPDAGTAAQIIDLCAAPGGKTVLLARGAHPQTRVLAVERSAPRAKRIAENLARAAVAPAVEVRVDDARTTALPPADVVLVDAPCTGLGTTRRKPEIKLRRTDADVVENARLQAELLSTGAAAVKLGGVLVYAVCSPLPQEGRDQIAAFLKTGTFALEDARVQLPWLPATAVDAQGCVCLRPHLHDADAFFAARLRRLR